MEEFEDPFLAVFVIIVWSGAIRMIAVTIGILVLPQTRNITDRPFNLPGLLANLVPPSS